MKKITLVASALALMCVGAFGQGNNSVEPHAHEGHNHDPATRTCGTMDVNDPQLLEELEEQLAPQIAAYIQSRNLGNNPEAIYTIPTVVHIIHNSNEGVGTGRNIPNARVQEQMTILNDDFRRTNNDAVNTPSYFTGVAADCEINFCLVTTYPSGHPQAGQTLPEPGVDRVSTAQISGLSNTTSGYSTNVVDNTIKPATSWNPDEVMNIWVCQLQNGLLGYATFPNSSSANRDGTVMGYQYFGLTGGPYGLGRTTTHEVGHWLGLYHIWGDDGGACSGSDQCADTPNQANSTGGCPSGVRTDACTGGNGIMYQNYMDYSNDACMNIFTQDQKARMQSVMASQPRRSTLNGFSGTLCSVASNPDDAGIAAIITPAGTTCSGNITPSVDLQNFGTNNLTSVTINYAVDGTPQAPYAWSGNLASGATTTVNLPAISVGNGAHTFDANTTMPNSTADTNPGNDAANQTNFTVSAPITIPFNYRFESFPLCGTASDCETEVCNMLNGWTNEANQVVDDIDWRTDEGGTPSNGTGPATDFNPGTATGNYLYLEASGNPVCSNKQANLISPCIDLTSVSSAALTFAYHMNGATMGSLHVDIYVNGNWINDITPVISGNQGNSWLQRTEPLTAYLGNIVQLRFRGITGANWESDIAIDDIGVSGTVDVRNESLANRFDIFPNPSNGIFNFAYSGDEMLTAKVIDMNGKVVSVMQLQPMENGVIDLSDYSNGLYMVVLTNGEYLSTKRIIKK